MRSVDGDRRADALARRHHAAVLRGLQVRLDEALGLCAAVDGFSKVLDVIDAAANKITSISVSTSAPAIGGSFDVTSVGDTGTIEDRVGNVSQWYRVRTRR